MHIVRVPVDSATIAAVGYSIPESVLEVSFHSGAVYRYFAVPPLVYQALQASGSKGRYFNSCIRGRFSYARLPTDGNTPRQAHRTGSPTSTG